MIVDSVGLANNKGAVEDQVVAQIDRARPELVISESLAHVARLLARYPPAKALDVRVKLTMLLLESVMMTLQRASDA